ncbi:MAG: ADP-ribosylglycohydrolase family protein [Verrucomicrobiae bacterium]|nr:ADP-ribosylglycohydrolase family protein [Verrucomicrobiae bacterium]
MKYSLNLYRFIPLTFLALLPFGCGPENNEPVMKSDVFTLSRTEYADRLYGFWLAECIANWTGLITEMDKIGGDGLDGRGAGFYTREDWGGPDQPNLWGHRSGHSKTIDFYLDPGEMWGADDDTDIEYIYQYITWQSKDPKLTGKQIRDGWLTHIYSDENTPFSRDGGKTPENFLWVSNQSAHDLMLEGFVPPETSDPARNPNWDMIDAQLTTEIFGLFAPGRPEVARELAYLPIRTTARENAAWISEFYVTLHSLASVAPESLSMKERIHWMLDEAREVLPEDSYSAKMYDFVNSQYNAGVSWEAARDALYEKYQVRQEDGYEWATKEPVCQGCFAAGINFGASMVSLLYGEGDLKETIKIGVLSGWDSDNPSATWGGLLGFMVGRAGVEKAFGRTFPDKFNIHRTRGGFPNDGVDTFENMAATGIAVVDRVVEQYLGGRVDKERDAWVIPR